MQPHAHKAFLQMLAYTADQQFDTKLLFKAYLHELVTLVWDDFKYIFCDCRYFTTAGAGEHGVGTNNDERCNVQPSDEYCARSVKCERKQISAGVHFPLYRRSYFDYVWFKVL